MSDSALNLGKNENSSFEMVEPSQPNNLLKQIGECSCEVQLESCSVHQYIAITDVASAGLDRLQDNKTMMNDEGKVLCYKSESGWIPELRGILKTGNVIRAGIAERVRQVTAPGQLFRNDEYSKYILERFADPAGNFPPKPEFASGSKIFPTVHESFDDKHGRFPHDVETDEVAAKFSHLKVGVAPKVVISKKPDARVLENLNNEPLAFKSFQTDVQTIAMYDPATKLWKAQVLPAGEFGADHWERMYHYPDGFITGMVFYKDEDGIYGFRIDKHIQRACNDAKRRDFDGVTPEFLQKLFAEQLQGDQRWIPKVANEAGNRYYGRFIGYPTNSAPPLRGKEKEMMFLGTPVGPYRNLQMLQIRQMGPRPVVSGFADVKSPMNYAGPVGQFAPFQDGGYHEAMFMADAANGKKRVQEGTSVNYAFVQYSKDGGKPVVNIPCLKPGDILPGITMQSVVDLAKHYGYEVIHSEIHQDGIHSADEILVTGTAMSVRGVSKIDDVQGKTIFESKNGNKLGTIAQRFADDFQLILKRQHPNPELNAWMQKIA